MKGRLVKDKGGSTVFLCSNGNKLLINKAIISALLYDFKEINENFWVSDEVWKTEQAPSMELYPGKTLAFITDDNQLVILDSEPFRLLLDESKRMPVDKYLSAVEYAEKYNKSREIIKVYCRQGRIPGAVKINDNWLIPKDAPYPVSTSRQRTPDTLGAVGRPKKQR